MSAIEKLQEGKYKAHPDRWAPQDLRKLDRLILAFGPDNPFREFSFPLEFGDDVREACAASWYALRELRKHIVDYKRSL